ncbi:MAG: CBS domain-containing protein [Metallibacterium scheffleri]
MLIRDLMTPDPVTVHPETPVEDIAGLLLAHRINGVPVVDEARRLLGIVTAADLIHRAADERLEPRESLWKENFWVSFLSPEGTHPGKAEGRTAAEVMTYEVHSVAPDDHPVVAARLMVDHHLTSLPVVEAGMVIGVISRIDLLRRLHELENPLRKND